LDFGAGNGFGIARAFGTAGFRLALASRTPAKQAEALKRLTTAGITAELFAADDGNPELLTKQVGFRPTQFVSELGIGDRMMSRNLREPE
jgi:hypothetical protein